MKRSDLVIPFSIVVHLLIINLSLSRFTGLNGPVYLWLFIDLAWLLPAFALNFYPTGRKEKFNDRFEKFFHQFLVFVLAYFTVLAFFRINFESGTQLKALCLLLVNLLIFRWFFYILRGVYRMEGGNSLSTVVIGKDGNLQKIQKVFAQPELGYRFRGFFNNTYSIDPNYRGRIEDCYDFILRENIDEIYCIASQLTEKELQKLIRLADNNLKKLKIIPDNKQIFTRTMNVELFETVPVINLRVSPLETEYAKMGKRVFDIIFSSLVIIGLLSWLTPLLALLIKLESPGPVFFKQLRHGHNKTPFWCYKFRSMGVNKDADSQMATKGDMRITKIGQFLRKTSIDELPQFFNVFLGDMSVVGPRPHMEAHTIQYQSSVDKYLVRHFAKPGITGLAQVKGFRGEILRESDIINRTRMDIFYLEKWSPLLDMKIIYSTVANAVKGEEKAY